MEHSCLLRDRGLNQPRSKEEVVALAEAMAQRLLERRLGGNATVRTRRRKIGRRLGREWEARVFLGKGGRFTPFFDDEVIQVRQWEIRFKLGSVWGLFDDLIWPKGPPGSLVEVAPIGPRSRESALAV